MTKDVRVNRLLKNRLKNKKEQQKTEAKRKHRQTTDTGPKKKKHYFNEIDHRFFFVFFSRFSCFLLFLSIERETKKDVRIIIIIIIKTRTRFETHRIQNTHHGDHVREIVPASLFEERDAHFDGASARAFVFLYVWALVWCLSSEGNALFF